MKLSTWIFLLTLAALSVACGISAAVPTQAAQPSPLVKSVPTIAAAVPTPHIMRVCAEIAVQTRHGAGVTFPTTGLQLKNGTIVKITGKMTIAEDMSVWQDTEYGFINARYLCGGE